jgi:hypothetical protein
MYSDTNKIRVDLTGAPETMLATLYARALDADADQPILGDTYAKELVQLGEKLGFEGFDFRCCFDDQVSVCEVADLGGEGDSYLGLIGGLLVESAGVDCAGKGFLDASAGGVCGFGVTFEHQYRAAGAGGNFGDACTHGAAADHADVVHCSPFVSSAVPDG